MSRHSAQLRSPVKATTPVARDTRRTTMPKYLLLKHYRGGPETHHPFPPMDSECRPGCTRPNGCARSSATGTGVMRSAATCTSSAAT
jgi:hypothetical protein